MDRCGRWIPAGCVAGVYASWQGRIGGQTVIDLNVRWRKGQTLDPDWKLDGDGWKITIDGRPTVTMNVGFLPPPDLIENAKTIEDFHNKAEFVRISGAGLRESHVHDVIITRESPNYPGGV